MHELFIDKYTDLLGIVKYEYYLKHFNENYGYRFRRPQVDVRLHSANIKSPFLNDAAKGVAVLNCRSRKYANNETISLRWFLISRKNCRFRSCQFKKCFTFENCSIKS